MLHHPNHAFEPSEIRRKTAEVFRQKIRARVQTYERPRNLPALMHCPTDWQRADDKRITHAILRRLKLALYQQRQARAIRHYTFSQQKYEALLVAIGGELALLRQPSRTGLHPAESDSRHPTRSPQFQARPCSFL